MKIYVSHKCDLSHAGDTSVQLAVIRRPDPC